MKVDFCCHSIRVILLDENGNMNYNEHGILEHVAIGEPIAMAHAWMSRLDVGTIRELCHRRTSSIAR
jgi:hypothetical protein